MLLLCSPLYAAKQTLNNGDTGLSARTKINENTTELYDTKITSGGDAGTPSALVGTNITGTASGLTAGAVTNATLTTAVTVDTGTVGLTGNAANTSVLTLGAGASSVAGDNSGDQDASGVAMPEIGTATYDDTEDWYNNTQSAGVISGGVISDSGSGQVDVSAITGIIKTTNSIIGNNVFFDLGIQVDQTLTDESINYIAVDYNAGTPQLVIGTTNTANGHTIFNLGKVFREGTGVDIVTSGIQVQDVIKRIQQHHLEESPLHFVSGAAVSETGTRNIAITAGVMYSGLNRIITDAIDTSAASTFEYYYYNGSAWIESDQTAIDNLQYNNIASGLASLANDRYGVHWVYKGTNGNTYVIYGQDSYKLTKAQASQPPASIPSHVEEMGVLVARIIIEQNASTFLEIDKYSDTKFTYATASNHNELGGLQGGTTSEYYHTTVAQHTIITRAATNAQAGYATAAHIVAIEALPGDCTVAPCYDGTADSGTILYWMNPAGTFYTALQGGATTANRSWRLPIGAAPSAGTTTILNLDEYGQMGQLSTIPQSKIDGFGASATPAIIMNDSDNAAGTSGLFGNSSGGANDIILSIGVEDSTGESTVYIEVDGVSETADFLKPTTLQAGDVVKAELNADAKEDAIEFVIDGGGSAITTGVKGYLELPWACTISSVTTLADQSGSIVIDIWVDTYANYPPIDADSITASAPPTITTATKAQDATLTGWTISLTKGDIIGFNVDSATTVERVTISIKVDK